MVSRIFCILVFLVTFSTHSFAQNSVSGVIYEDFNANGQMDSLEPGVAGIQVNIYDAGGNVAGTATSASDGTYSASLSQAVGTRVRVEISSIPSYFASGVMFSTSNPSVTFAAVGSSGVDFSVNAPESFCDTNPTLVTSCFVSDVGFPIAPTGNEDVLVSFLNNAGSVDPQLPAPAHLGIKSEMGPVWGIAHQRSDNKIFSSALMKRHVAFGPGGTGGIYITDPTLAVPGASSLFVDLNTILPGAANAGTDPHPGGTNFLYDPNGWDGVGKIGFGDMDISPDETTLYVVNLASRELLEIEIGVPAVAPTINEITRYVIPAPDNTYCGATANTDWRPWALKFYKGKVYVGGVCSGESTVSFNYAARNLSDANYVNPGTSNFGDDPTSPAFGDSSSLSLHVFEFTPGSGFNSTAILNAPLDFPRRPVSDTFAFSGTLPNIEGNWLPWVPQFTISADGLSAATVVRAGWPQPIFSDIEFDSNGDMILGFSDRVGHQLAAVAGSTDDGTDGTVDPRNYLAFSGGDIYRACLVSGNFVMEANGSCGGITTSGATNNDGPLANPLLPYNVTTNPSGEYYYEDLFVNAHGNISVGGLAQIPGFPEVASTVLDPAGFVFAGGVNWFTNTSGAREHEYVVFTSASPGTLGKAAGLGDIEPLCSAAPVEIGNYIWRDSDGDGVQDPDENPISGVVVNLLNSSGTVIATATTNANGEYTFISDSAPKAGASDPAIGEVVGGISFNTDYKIQIADSNFNSGGPLSGLIRTVANASSTGNSDGNDSDGEDITMGAMTFTGVMLTTGNPGENNHSYDFGFGELRIGDLIWFDTDGDGVQDTGEPGISGVELQLIQKSTMAVLATTTTDSNGNYYFSSSDGLTPNSSDFAVKVTNANFQSGGALFGLGITLFNQGSDTAVDSTLMEDSGMFVIMVNTPLTGAEDLTFDGGVTPDVTATDLSSTQQAMDGALEALARVARRANRRYTRGVASGECTGTPAIGASEMRNDINQARLAGWTATWLLQSFVFDFSGDVPSFCAEVDVSSEKQSIRAEGNKIIGAAKKRVRTACNNSWWQPLSKKLKRRKKQLRSALREYTNPAGVCPAP